MNEDVKRKWLKALRSGDYPQTHGILHDEEGFCCLGVLCDLAVEGGVVDPPKKIDYISHDRKGQHVEKTYYVYGEEKWRELLPRKVMAWAGLVAPNPLVKSKLGLTLSGLNDRGRSFKQIANIIERQL